MNFLRTLRSNWRDLLAFLIVSTAFAWISGALNELSRRDGLPLGIADLASNLMGLSKFVSANFAVALIGLPITWPTLNRYNNLSKTPDASADPGTRVADRESFASGFAALTPAARFFVFVAVAIGEGLMAALCFAS